MPMDSPRPRDAVDASTPGRVDISTMGMIWPAGSLYLSSVFSGKKPLEARTAYSAAAALPLEIRRSRSGQSGCAGSTRMRRL
ncbi:hypothetical protein SALBM311S_05424 [Streptomyces alboniger]